MWRAVPLCTALGVQRTPAAHDLCPAMSLRSGGMERALVGPTMRLPQIIALALSISTAACAVEVEGDDEPGLEETDYIILNALTGTANAVTALRTHALATATFNPMGGAIPTALNDPHARNFMTYLVQCALDTSDVVS